MWFVLVFLALFVLFCIYLDAKGKKQRQKSIKEIDEYVKQLGDDIRVVVNDGRNLFYVDDVTQTYGIDKSGKKYNFDDINSVSTHKGGLTIQQGDGGFIEIGKTINNLNIMSQWDINSILVEVQKPIKYKLSRRLEANGITPRAIFDCSGSLWGCDLDSRVFFTTKGGISFYNFSDFLGATVEDPPELKGMDAAAIIHLRVKSECDLSGEFEYDIYFNEKNGAYFGMIDMIKGIKNRR